MVAALAFVLVLAGCRSAYEIRSGDIVLENAKARFVIGADGSARSLVIKKTGVEMLDPSEGRPAFSVTQDRPFNNEIKLIFPNCQTTYRADRVRREGDFLIVGFELISYSAKIRVTEADGYFVFELVDFILGPKGTDHLAMTYPPVKSLRLLELPVRERARFGEWLNVAWDDEAAAAVVAAEPYIWTGNEMRRGTRHLFADAHRDLKLRGAKAALIAAEGDAFLDAVDAMERGLGLPLGVASRRSDDLNASVYWTSYRTVKSVGTQYDMWEFGTSRAAAWDCPMTIQIGRLAKHPRADDLLEVIRRWEDVRARKWLTPGQKEALKSETQEHHLYLNGKGEYELVEMEMLPTPAKAPSARAFIFARDGKRVIAYWHTSGAARLAVDLGKPAEVALDRLRYLETPLSFADARAAWAAAVEKK